MKRDSYSRGGRGSGRYNGCGKGRNDGYGQRSDGTCNDGHHYDGRRHDGMNGGRYSDGFNNRDTYDYDRTYDTYAQGSLFSGPFYRARGGKAMGVCLGLSRKFDISVVFIRLAFIFLAISTGFMPAILLYVILGVLMKPEPVIRPHSYEERDFYSSYVSSRKQAASNLKEKFDRVEKRIRDMEDVVTSKEYDWERRFSQKS